MESFSANNALIANQEIQLFDVLLQDLVHTRSRFCFAAKINFGQLRITAVLLHAQQYKIKQVFAALVLKNIVKAKLLVEYGNIQHALSQRNDRLLFPAIHATKAVFDVNR